MTRSFPTLVLGATLALGLSTSPASAQTTDYAAEIERLAAHPAIQRALLILVAQAGIPGVS